MKTFEIDQSVKDSLNVEFERVGEGTVTAALLDVIKDKSYTIINTNFPINEDIYGNPKSGRELRRERRKAERKNK